jgi:S-formylglutathione hydrolase FrmB
MKIVKTFMVLALLSFALETLHAQGIVNENQKVESEILDKEVEYAVYLPPDYETSNRYYPVVYLLHGYTDDETAWIQFGEVNTTLDVNIESGKIPPMIVIMPDAGVSWYINDCNNETPYEDFFVKEFIPQIENKYRIRKSREFRGISGLSMGGHGALILSMHNTDLFGACAAFSAGIYTANEFAGIEQDDYDRMFATLYGENLSGKERITDHWKKNSPVYQAENMDKSELSKVKWYIDCGDDDFLYNGNSNLHIILRYREIPHEYRVRDGRHSWSYWRGNIIHGLKFLGDSFNR